VAVESNIVQVLLVTCVDWINIRVHTGKFGDMVE